MYDIDVEISDNTIVIVGENGTGKSTLISLIYYALTAQWSRLAGISFKDCTLTIDDKLYRFEREAIQVFSRKRHPGVEQYIRRRLGSRSDAILSMLDRHDSEYWLNSRHMELRKFHSQYMPSSFPMQALIDYVSNLGDPSLLPVNYPDIEQFEQVVRQRMTSQVLFLPTYRRIEKELRAVFPDLDLAEGLESYNKHRDAAKERGYIELVEFGMTDVIETFKSTLTSLDRNFRSELNRLTGTYLRDVIRGEYRQSNTEELAAPKVAQTVEAMLSRIEDEILPQEDRDRLHVLLAEIQSGRPMEQEQRILAYFLSKLVGIHQSQQDREKPVRQFVAICNRYLTGKQFVFDPLSFELSVQSTLPIQKTAPGSYATIQLQGLSSGEKQIVSLFAHVLLSKSDTFFVLIDEPELSILVEWQRRFLEDIRATGLCRGLIAVTHSPCICENTLASYAHSIQEFIKTSEYPETIEEYPATAEMEADQ
ncbi:MAG: AAA family ATPase [Halobacteriota archaeon]